jgi:hypothetical protein
MLGTHSSEKLSTGFDVDVTGASSALGMRYRPELTHTTTSFRRILSPST